LVYRSCNRLAAVPPGVMRRLSYWTVVEGKGGHTSLVVQNDFEYALLHHLHGQLGYVSYEAVLSGSGLVGLHHAVVTITGVALSTGAADGVLPPEGIGNFAAIGTRGVAAQAATAFCRLLGWHAGDLALIFGARGGANLAGGIIPGMGSLFNREVFRPGCEARGQLSDYVAVTSSYIIMAPTLMLTSLARFASHLKAL
jgi:glucokinase